MATRIRGALVIDALMTDQGWTNRGLAFALNVTPQLLWQTIRKTKTPEDPLLSRIAAVLRVERTALVDADGHWR